MKSILKNINLLISVRWQFQKYGLQYFRFKFDWSTNKQPEKKITPFISIVQMKFGQNLWSHFFKISTFWYQPHEHFKNVEFRPLKQMVQIKFGENLWSHFLKISAFWCQSPDHFKTVDRNTSGSIFNKFSFLTNKRPYPEWKINVSNQIWKKVMKSLFQNINLLISVTWPSQNCGLLCLWFLKWDIDKQQSIFPDPFWRPWPLAFAISRALHNLWQYK